MSTVVNLQSFKERFVSGLVFSMIEGLEEGGGIRFQAKYPLDTFKQQLQALALPGIQFETPSKRNGFWELHVFRISAEIKDSKES